MMKLTVCLVVSVMTLCLSGCVSPSDSAFSAIRPSADDVLTDGTADQILVHNLLGQELYGWVPNPH